MRDAIQHHVTAEVAQTVFRSAFVEEALLAQNRVEAVARYVETAWRAPPLLWPPGLREAVELTPGGRFAAEALTHAGAIQAAGLIALAGMINGAQIAAATFDAAVRAPLVDRSREAA